MKHTRVTYKDNRTKDFTPEEWDIHRQKVEPIAEKIIRFEPGKEVKTKVIKIMKKVLSIVTFLLILYFGYNAIWYETIFWGKMLLSLLIAIFGIAGIVGFITRDKF